MGQAFAVAAGDMTGVPVGSFSGARKLRDAALVPGLSKGAPLERRGRGGDKAGANEDKVGRIWSVGPARIGFQDSAALNPRARPAPEWWSPIVCPAKGPHQSITLMGTQAGDPVWAPAFAGAQFAEAQGDGKRPAIPAFRGDDGFPNRRRLSRGWRNQPSAGAVLRRTRIVPATAPKPMIIIAQVDGSGTEAALSVNAP